MHLGNPWRYAGLATLCLTLGGWVAGCGKADPRSVADMKAYATAVRQTRDVIAAQGGAAAVLNQAAVGRRLYRQLPPDPTTPGESSHQQTALLYDTARSVEAASDKLANAVAVRTKAEKAARNDLASSYDRLLQSGTATLGQACDKFLASYREAGGTP